MSNPTTNNYKKPVHYNNKELGLTCGSIAHIDGGVTSSNYAYIQMTMEDCSAAGSVAWAPCPVAGTVVLIQTIIDSALITADAVLTPQINTVAVTGGGITIAYSGSAVGDVDSSTPTAANTVAVGDSLEVSTNNASANVCIVQIIWKIRVTTAE